MMPVTSHRPVRGSSLFTLAALTLVALSGAGPARAQNACDSDELREAAYFTGPDNAISIADFAQGTSSVVIYESGSNFKGLAVSDECTERRVVVANTTNGGKILVYRVVGDTAVGAPSEIARLSGANGVALDADRGVWAVNADPGGPDLLVHISREGTGYSTNVESHAVSGVNRLAAVQVATTGRPGSVYQAGDVLVLSAAPARVDIVRRNPEPPPTLIQLPFVLESGFATFGSVTPTGLALAPDGRVFVAVSDGRILVFTVSGSPSGVFANLGGTPAHIAIGKQGGVDYLFAAVQTNGGRVLRYPLAGGGAAAIATNVPSGIGNAPIAYTAFTAESEDPVLLTAAPGHDITFGKTKTGSTSDGFYVVSEAAVRQAGSQLTLPGTGVTRAVPTYAHGFSYYADETCTTSDFSGCYYLVFATESTSGVFGTTQEHHIHEEDHGFEASCETPFGVGARQNRTFHATDANDDPVVEGTRYFDISSGCNGHLSRGFESSFFLTAWDERSQAAIVNDKLFWLEQALTRSDPAQGGLSKYIASKTRTTLLNLVKAAKQAAAANDFMTVEDTLDGFVATVESNLGRFTECPKRPPMCRNAPGELVARAASAAFMACGARPGSPGDDPPVPDGCNRRLQ
jgi:hypothetical protein